MTPENMSKLKKNALIYGVFFKLIDCLRAPNDKNKDKIFKEQSFWTKTKDFFDISSIKTNYDKIKKEPEFMFYKEKKITILIPINYMITKYDYSEIHNQNLWDKIKEHFENINKLNNEKQNEELNKNYSEYLKSKLKDPSPDNLHYLLEFLSIGNKFENYKTR